MKNITTRVLTLVFMCFANATAAQDMQPGMYAINATIELRAGGTPRSHQSRECITAKDIAGDMTKMGIESDGDCKAQNFSKGGGKISYRWVCEEDGKKIISNVTGSYSADSYDFTMVDIPKEAPYKAIRVKGKRVGACN